MKKIIISFIVLLLCNNVSSQSISLNEIETLIKLPISESEKYILGKSFTLTETKVISDSDIIKTYQKAFESIKLGRIWYKKDGSKLRDITYTTSDKVAMVYLISEIQDDGTFKYKSNTYDSELKGKFILLENKEYTIQIFISAVGEDNLIKLVEK